MASDYLLELDGIKGESTDKKHKDSIDIEAFSWGCSNPVRLSTSGGGGAGKVSFRDIAFTKQTDKSSPHLMLRCCNGQHIKKAVLYVRKQDGEQQEYYKVTLEDVLVSSFQASGAGGEVPSESFSLNFSKIELAYDYVTGDGSVRTERAGWDLKQNKAV